MKNKNIFIEDYKNGKATVEDIDEYVGRWQEGNGFGVSIYEYLGITKEQYFKWCKDSDSLENELKKIKDEN